jgi:hypothetical protein
MIFGQWVFRLTLVNYQSWKIAGLPLHKYGKHTQHMHILFAFYGSRESQLDRSDA